MSATSSKLKPYRLPSFSQLWEGAAQGMLGGVMAGTVSAFAVTTVGFLIALKVDMTSTSRGIDIVATITVWVNLIVVAGLVGAIIGLVVGGITGLVSYFVITPWIAADLWSELGLPMRRGMLTGSLIGAVASGIFIWVANSQYAIFLPPFLVRDSFGSFFYGLLLCPIGCIVGGFWNPLRAVVMPSMVDD